jgi:hypothetical protein
MVKEEFKFEARNPKFEFVPDFPPEADLPQA